MKRLLLLTLIIFIPFCVVNAKELNITIENVSIVENSDTVDVTLFSYGNNEVLSNITFNNLEEYVKYNITIKNNDEDKYLIKSITDNNENDNIEIRYEHSSEYIEPNGESVITMTIKYKKQLKNVERISLDDISISIIFDDGEVVINPKTFDNINNYLFIALLSIACLIVSIKYKKVRNKMIPVFVLFLLLPLTVIGKEVYTMKFMIKNIDITGVFDVFSVQINPDNNDNVINNEIRYGDKIGPLTNPNKEGYTFIGWFDSNNNQVTPDTIVTSDLTITARYTAIEYPITYNLNGGASTNVTKYTIEDEINLVNPTKNGYNFLGWYLNSSFDGETVTKINRGSTGPKEFYAKWEAIDYSITYNLNGGTQGINAILEYNVESNDFDLPLPKRTNYHFKGWYSNESLTGNVTNNIKKGTTGNKVYYAKWEEYKDYSGYNVYDVVKDDAVSDAVKSLFVPRDNGVDFGKSSGISNGTGKYYMESTKNDPHPIYYYRGDVEDNHVLFGGYCWLIVRTTDTGGIKIVYDGLEDNGKCLKTGTDTFISSKIKFNSSYSRTESTGYTYNGSHTQSAGRFSNLTTGMILGNDVVYENGKYKLQDTYVIDDEFQNNIDEKTKTHHYTCNTTSDECESVRFIFMGRDPQYYYITLTGGEKIEDVIEYKAFNPSNTTNSTIKTNIDTWYSNNMTSVESYLEDTVWCNDRSLPTKGGWDKDSSIYEKAMFGATYRVSSSLKPSVACVNKNDRYTVSSEKGNGVLNYPIGLLTADETALAGFAWFEDSPTTYLNNGHLWWTMSPSLLSANFSYIDVVYSMLDNVHAAYISSGSITTGGVRPAVSLKPTTKILSGNGTRENPYTVE